MFNPRKILASVDATAMDHPALDVAVRLATRGAAELKIVDMVPELPWIARSIAPESIERDLVRYREEHLAVIKKSLANTGISIRTAVLRGPAALALAREVLEFQHDLVIRAHGQPGPGMTERQFGAIDMQLLRICPCPVWLVAASAAHSRLRVLIALDAASGDPSEQQLNHRIVDIARSVARPDAIEITVLHAWTAFGEQLLRSHMPPHEVAAYIESARSAASRAFDDLADELRQQLGQVHLELQKGEAADVIVHAATQRSVDLVIMGTVGRSGIQGLIMGNTAETVLQRLRCSVLAIKPEGFVSPAAPHSA
jgi:universal stress protein E